MQTKASRGAGIIPPIENDRKGLGNSFFKGLPISNGVGGKARKASKDKVHGKHRSQSQEQTPWLGRHVSQSQVSTQLSGHIRFTEKSISLHDDFVRCNEVHKGEYAR